MLKIKNLRGQCQHCGGPIEFHAEFTGDTADCPHCGQPTELLLAPPPEERDPVRRKAIVFTVIAVLILLGGVVGTILALRRAERLKQQALEISNKMDAARPPAPANPFAAVGFQVSPVALERTTNNALTYAIGTILNLMERQRFGVKVELELLDATGSTVGVAQDYRAVLEPNAEWKFRALVTERRAVAAKVAAIKEN